MRGLERHLPERERLNVTSCSHGRGKPQKLTFQVCYKTSELHLDVILHEYCDVTRSKPTSMWESKPPYCVISQS